MLIFNAVINFLSWEAKFGDFEFDQNYVAPNLSFKYFDPNLKNINSIFPSQI